MEVIEAVPKIDSFKDAMKSLEDVQQFLLIKEFTEEYLKVDSLVTAVAGSSLILNKHTLYLHNNCLKGFA